jgi:3-phenylpropionate/trans-cinnamate dioxygenase ferredoxin subunit
MEFVKVARLSEIPLGRGKLIRLEGEEVALWRTEGQVYAINNVCPHQHFSMLHQGTVKGIELTCPMHGWTFSLDDGRATTGNGRARVYHVKVEGEDVYVEKPRREF